MTENLVRDGEVGVAAWQNMFRLLAATGSGATTDFATDVVAGLREPHELLTYTPAVEEDRSGLDALPNLLDRLPQADLDALRAQAPNIVRRVADELATMDVEAVEAELSAATPSAPVPERAASPTDDRWSDDDDDYFSGSFLRA
ncbi:MAG: hypothetical protein GEU98_24745 [Pseudonocardiaceae bacterium]|nr:hypothetical protein [Pseudonocardiaceae bacterium]